MTRATLDELARTIAQGFHDEHAAFCRHLLRLLADGHPVSVEQVATTLHRSRDEVMETLRQLPDLEFDEEGLIVGTGLSLVPTPHQFQINGYALFTWCALDTLIYPVLLQQSARVESSCPITGAPIRLNVTPERIVDLESESSVVSMLVSETSGACHYDRDTFCNHGHFFRSGEAASTWQVTHQDAVLLPVEEAYQLGRLVFRHEEAFLLRGQER